MKTKMIEVYVPKEGKISTEQLKEVTRMKHVFEDYECLHPIDQVETARKMTLFLKQSRFIIKTHSPLFIEALEVYAGWYRTDIKFWLWKDKHNIEEVKGHCGMVKLYKVLGDPYDKIDEISGMLDARTIKEGRKLVEKLKE